MPSPRSAPLLIAMSFTRDVCAFAKALKALPSADLRALCEFSTV